MKLSNQDKVILRAIQRDSSQSLANLADLTGVPQSTLWRKLNELEKAGVIDRRVALLNPRAIGAGLCVFALVSLEDHSEEAVKDFTGIVGRHPEILECSKISGAADYILKIRVENVDAYEDFQTRHLLRNRWVRSVQSSFVLKEEKATTELPL